VYQLGSDGAGFRPFLTAGLGATRFSASDLESETKLSWALGAGLKWFRSARLGARLHARYNPTHLNDDSSDFCDPFGFCQGWLQQFEVMGGVVMRF
jgi:opacity protein-like surface antigen